MTYYGAKELADSFRTVRKNTLIIAEEIPEEKYGYRIAPELRSVGEFLTHISNATTLQERIHGTERRTTLEGFDFPAFMMQALAKEKQPRSKAATIQMLRADGDRFERRFPAATPHDLFRVLHATQVDPRRALGVGSRETAPRVLLRGHFEVVCHLVGQLLLGGILARQLMVIERMLGIVPHLTREMQARIAQMTQSKATA